MSNQNKTLFSETPEKSFYIYNKPYQLSSVQIEEYQNNGFIKLSQVLSDEALKYARAVITTAVDLRTEKDKRALNEKSPYEQSFKQCGYLCWDYPAV